MSERTIELVFPSEKHQKLCADFVKDHEKEKPLHGASGIERLPFDTWLERVSSMRKSENLPEGYVPATILLCLAGGELKGFTNIRHHLNERLLRTSGHIGFIVHKDERKKGYGKAILQASLRYAKKHLGIKKALVSCSTRNEASRRTIVSCGGGYENTVQDEEQGNLERYWIDI